MKWVHQRSITICNALLSALNRSTNKTTSPDNLLKILEGFFPNWRANRRERQSTLYRYIKLIRTDGIDLKMECGNYVLYDTRAEVTDSLGVGTLDKAFATIGKILIPVLGEFPLSVDSIERINQGLCIYVNNNREIFNIVLRSFLRKTCLLIDFKEDDVTKEATIEPHGLFLWDGEWIVAVLEQGGVNYYRINNIIKAYEINKPFTFNNEVITAVAELLIKE